MKVPTKDKCNGIILGYVVYFSEKQHDYLQFTEYNKTVLRNDNVEGFTRTSIYGLKAYTWYQFETVAFTSIGEGNRTSQVLYILTFEDGKSFWKKSLIGCHVLIVLDLRGCCNNRNMLQ